MSSTGESVNPLHSFQNDCPPFPPAWGLRLGRVAAEKKEPPGRNHREDSKSDSEYQAETLLFSSN